MNKLQRRILTSLTLVLGLGGVSGLAYADSTGDWGRVVSVRVTAQGSDDYGRFRGKVELAGRRTHPKKRPEITEYVWGGSSCPGRDLSDSQVHQLQDAMTHRAHLRLLPYYKPGQGGAKCIVGFDVRGREALPPGTPPV